MVSRERGVKRGVLDLEKSEEEPAKVRCFMTCPQRVGDAIVTQITRSDLSPREAVFAKDIVHNFELLRVIISLIPTKVPGVPFLFDTLHHAQVTIGMNLPANETKSRAVALKALIQYVRHLWRKTERSRIQEVEALKAMCQPLSLQRGCELGQFEIKINHSHFFDPS